jgi:3-isopropylmalate/(R)-2-methylmalate dehydratase small subunit
MTKITTITSTAIPLTGNDIDTDRIIPARFLRCVTFDGLGANVFEDDRTQLKGTHPFDLPQFLAKWGIKAIVGESYSEIFFGNCVAMGIPCVTADPATTTRLQEILKLDPQSKVTLNLDSLQVQCGDFTAPIYMGEGSRQQLTKGTWDACGQLVANAAEIQVTATKLPYVAWG